MEDSESDDEPHDGSVDVAPDPEAFTVNLCRKYRLDESREIGAKVKKGDKDESAVTHCAFSPSKHSLVAYADDAGYVTIQDLNKPKLQDAITRCFKHGDLVNCVDFSHDGKMLAVGGGKVDEVGKEPRLRVYLVDDEPLPITLSDSPRSEDEKRFVVVKAYKAAHTILDLSFARTGELAYGGIDLPLKVVEGPTEQDVEDAKNGVDESKLEETDAGVAPADAAGAPPADAAGAAPADAAGVAPTDTDEEPVTGAEEEWGRWKQRSIGEKLDLEPQPWLSSVSFSPCATFLACVSKMGVLTVMKRKGSWTGEVELLYDRRESEDNAQRTKIVSSAACRFSPLLEGPDGPFVLLAVALMNHRVIVRDALTGYLRYVLDCKGPGNSVDFSRERSLLAVATSRGVRIFDASTGARAHYFKDERTECLCFSPSGFAIAYGTAAPPSHIAIRSLRIDTVERVIMNVDGTEIGKRNAKKQRRNSNRQLPHVDDERPDLTPQSSQSTLTHAETPPPAPKLTLFSRLTTASARALRSTRSADHVAVREMTMRQRFQKIGGT